MSLVKVRTVKVRNTKIRNIALVGTAGAVALVYAAQPASANSNQHHPTAGLKVVKTVATGYVGPLQFAVDHNQIYVADSFTSTLNKVGRSTPIATGPTPGDVAGVAIGDQGRSVAYTSSEDSHAHTWLTILSKGKKPVVADLAGFESRRNPDGFVHYGIRNPSQCVIDGFPPDAPASYQGQIDSHPYSVASLGHGNWVVGDAGGNDLLKVDARGHVSLIAVLPRQPLKISAAFAAALGLPDCAVGLTYNFEPVPTDVEVGADGWLYVSTLPGGPEDPSAGARGSVYKVNPHSGKAILLATGLAGATNLALDNHCNIYVVELFAGQISKIVRGKGQPVLSLPAVAAVEYANGALYASTAPALNNSPDPGTIVKLGPDFSASKS
ncbi:ScyD/ScyE family protein [Jatrophihabitans sp. DSM 45814]